MEKKVAFSTKEKRRDPGGEYTYWGSNEDFRSSGKSRSEASAHCRKSPSIAAAHQRSRPFMKTKHPEGPFLPRGAEQAGEEQNGCKENPGGGKPELREKGGK